MYVGERGYSCNQCSNQPRNFLYAVPCVDRVLECTNGVCTCLPGYTGRDCCACEIGVHNCTNGICFCKEGYMGADCCDCAEGYERDNENDECLSKIYKE